MAGFPTGRAFLGPRSSGVLLAGTAPATCDGAGCATVEAVAVAVAGLKGTMEEAVAGGTLLGGYTGGSC